MNTSAIRDRLLTGPTLCVLSAIIQRCHEFMIAIVVSAHLTVTPFFSPTLAKFSDPYKGQDKCSLWAEEMAQQERVHHAFEDDLSSVPSSHNQGFIITCNTDIKKIRFLLLASGVTYSHMHIPNTTTQGSHN